MNWDKTNGVRASLIPFSDFSAALHIKRESTPEFCGIQNAASKVM